MENKRDIEGIASLKKVVKGAGIVFIGMIISKFMTFFYRLFIARYFGPEDYGLFSLGLAVLGFTGVVASLGMSNSVTRFIAYYRTKNEKEKIKGVLTSAIKIVLSSSFLIAGILFIFSPYIAINFFNNPELTNLFRILSISIPFSVVTGIFTSAFLGFQQVKYRVYTIEIFNSLVKLITVVTFGILGYGVLGIGLSWTMSAIFSFLFAFYLMEKKVFSLIKSKIKSSPLKRELLTFAMPLVFSGIMAFIISWTDTLMLGYFLSSEKVGIYNAAYPVAMLFLTVPGALGILFVPIATEFYIKQKLGELKIMHKTITKWIFYLNFPILLLVVFFSKQILKLLFGAEYISGYLALIFLSITFFMVSVYWTSGGILEVIKKTRYLMINSTTASLINISFNWYLIPLYGINGAAIASASSYFVLLGLLGIEVWYFTKLIPYSKGFIKSFAAGSLSILFVHYLASSFFTIFPAYVLVSLFSLFIFLYGFLLLQFGGVEKEDLEILKAIEQKIGIRVEFLRKIVKRFVK